MTERRRRHRSCRWTLALVSATVLSSAARAQVEHMLPPQATEDTDLDAEALKQAKPMERNLTVPPPELLGSEAPEARPEPPKTVPGRE